METVTITTWIWGTKYSGDYLARLKDGVRGHLKRYHRFLVLTPPPGDEALLAGCFVRMRLFDPAFIAAQQIPMGSQVLNLDLDLVITGSIDHLFDDLRLLDEPLVILAGANAANPCPFNASVFRLTAGAAANADIWLDLTPDAIGRLAHYQFPDDQGWLHHKRPNAATWKAGASSGIYAFKKPGWPEGDGLPGDASIVCFPGKRDPSQFTHLPWIREHWR